jgi:hypothetical protein
VHTHILDLEFAQTLSLHDGALKGKDVLVKFVVFLLAPACLGLKGLHGLELFGHPCLVRVGLQCVCVCVCVCGCVCVCVCERERESERENNVRYDDNNVVLLMIRSKV